MMAMGGQNYPLRSFRLSFLTGFDWLSQSWLNLVRQEVGMMKRNRAVATFTFSLLFAPPDKHERQILGNLSQQG